MEYLKSFTTDAEYQQFLGGGDFITPNVSAVEENNKVYYNPIFFPLPRYNNYDFPLNLNSSLYGAPSEEQKIINKQIASIYKDIYDLYNNKFGNVSSVYIGGFSEKWDEKVSSGVIDNYWLIQSYDIDGNLLYEDNIINEPLYVNWLQNVTYCIEDSCDFDCEIEMFSDTVYIKGNFIVIGTLCPSQELGLGYDGNTMAQPTC